VTSPRFLPPSACAHCQRETRTTSDECCAECWQPKTERAAARLERMFPPKTDPPPRISDIPGAVLEAVFRLFRLL